MHTRRKWVSMGAIGVGRRQKSQFLGTFMHYSQVVGEVVLLLDVDVEAVGDLVEVVLADAADEAVVAEVVLHALHHVTEGAERVDDET